jgi:hypothetical protein
VQQPMLAVLGLLDGTVMCVAAAAAAAPDCDMHSALQCAHQQSEAQQEEQQPQQQHEVAAAQLPVSRQQQQQRVAQPVALSVLWQASGGASVFSSPVVVEAQGLVVSAAVDGLVTAFDLHSGHQVWRVQLQQQVFADLLLQPLQRPGPSSSGSSSSGSSRNSRRARSVVLVATQAGGVVGLDSSSGHKVGGDPVRAVCHTTYPGWLSTKGKTVLSWQHGVLRWLPESAMCAAQTDQ